MQVELVTQADEELFDAFQRLVPQLTDNNPPPSLNDLAALVRDSSSTLMVTRNESGEIVAALTLAVYRVPTGVRSIIEDVIVDNSVRGQGMGESLVKRAIEIAREKGAANISLTCNPMRKSANRLYQRMGFKKRDTNSYQMKL